MMRQAHQCIFLMQQNYKSLNISQGSVQGPFSTFTNDRCSTWSCLIFSMAAGKFNALNFSTGIVSSNYLLVFFLCVNLHHADIFVTNTLILWYLTSKYLVLFWSLWSLLSEQYFDCQKISKWLFAGIWNHQLIHLTIDLPSVALPLLHL